MEWSTIVAYRDVVSVCRGGHWSSLGSSCGGSASASLGDVAQMADGASRFLTSLSDEERGRATFAFESDERVRFHFVPPETFERHGLPLKDMTGEQRDLAHSSAQDWPQSEAGT